MVFIIGVDHLVQYSGPAPEYLRIEFREYLVSASRGNGIRLIAEEFSLEALRDVYGSANDTAQEAAAILGIGHLYCDPEEKDLRKLGIPRFAEILDCVKREHGITEKFILDDHARKKVRAEAVVRAKSYWRARELFWYGRIEPDIGSNILFICGHEHAERFRSLLKEKGHDSRILDPWWRGDIFRDYGNIGLG